MSKHFQMMIARRERKFAKAYNDLLRKYDADWETDDAWLELRVGIRMKQDEVGDLCPNKTCVDGKTIAYKYCDECFAYWYIGS